MEITLHELKQRMATTMDECAILDLLDIDSYKLVDYLEEEIERRYDYLLGELEELYQSTGEEDEQEDEQMELDFD